MLSDTGSKLRVAGALLVMAYVSAIVPRFTMANNLHLFSLGNMMASGVLLGASLIHLLPGAQNLFDASEVGEYPWASFICGCTFTLFLMLEESMHLFLKYDADDKDSNNNTNQSICRASTILSAGRCDTARTTNYQAIDEDLPTNFLRHQSDCCSHSHSHVDRRSDRAVSSSWLNASFASNQEHHHHDEHLDKHLHGSALSSVALMLALSIHSILEGFSLGLADSRTALSTAVAILLHKVFAGYALGSALTAASDSIHDKVYLTMISIFALSTPLGIIIAVAMSESLSLNDAIVAMFQAAVAGTFLYISIIEVGMKELLVCRVQAGLSVLAVGKRLEVCKLLSFLFGYSAMALLAVWV